MNTSHQGSFLEIVVVRNGFAVYDYSVHGSALHRERSAMPIVVFSSKRELAEWMAKDWTAMPHQDWNAQPSSEKLTPVK
jgi:hypothetical protein